MENSQKLKPFLEKAIQTYQHFATLKCPMDAKNFQAYHSACKMALLHIALLDKLVTVHCKNENEPNLLDLVHQAQMDLKDENDISGIRMDLE